MNNYYCYIYQCKVHIMVRPTGPVFERSGSGISEKNAGRKWDADAAGTEANRYHLLIRTYSLIELVIFTNSISLI